MKLVGKVVSSFTLCCEEGGRWGGGHQLYMLLPLLFIEGLSQGLGIDFCLDEMG